MVRRYDVYEEQGEGEFCLTVRCAPSEYPITLTVSREETVEDLKHFLSVEWERYLDEMTVAISLAYPYPLADTLRLGRLRIEHRHLMVHVHEGGSEVGMIGEEEEAKSVWWAQPVPLRYLQPISEDGGDVLDFRYLVVSGIPRIRAWLYYVQTCHLPVKEIWLLGTHPHIGEILCALAEDILTLGELMTIRVFHPESGNYLLPAFSCARHESLRGNGWASHLTRESLVYLYQHLATDRYRHQAEDVHIVVDAGLLSGHEERGRWLP